MLFFFILPEVYRVALCTIIEKPVTKVSFGVINLEIYGMVLCHLIIRVLECIEALFTLRANVPRATL